MFLRVWHFRASPGNEEEFETVYGPGGDWGRLFRSGPGYLGTELLKAEQGKGEYVTIDRWESRDAWINFLELHSGEYKALDRACERLCSVDACIGVFVAVDEQSRAQVADG
ncbi:MAG TPA: antibiotic biosynthesis monooxygenase family protein [Gemmatimonadaceae bacterium]|nr:antibiotic biosynthesis monooxygenase family protein [Gemmatimonadaceae bacterium]